MNYGLAEREIANILRTVFEVNEVSEFYDAMPFPQTEAEFKDLQKNFKKSTVAVQFYDTTPQPSNSSTIVTQNETVKFRLTIAARMLRGPGQGYALMQAIKLILIGYRLENSLCPLTFVRYGQLDFEQNGWQPYMEFECKFTNVQAFNYDEDELNYSRMTVPEIPNPRSEENAGGWE